MKGELRLKDVWMWSHDEAAKKDVQLPPVDMWEIFLFEMFDHFLGTDAIFKSSRFPASVSPVEVHS